MGIRCNKPGDCIWTENSKSEGECVCDPPCSGIKSIREHIAETEANEKPYSAKQILARLPLLDFYAPADEGPIINPKHPFWHLCRKCVNFGKVVTVAVVVEAIIFWPTHWVFHSLGWI